MAGRDGTRLQGRKPSRERVWGLWRLLPSSALFNCILGANYLDVNTDSPPVNGSWQRSAEAWSPLSCTGRRPSPPSPLHLPPALFAFPLPTPWLLMSWGLRLQPLGAGEEGPQGPDAGGVSTAAAPGAEAATSGVRQQMRGRDFSSACSVLCCERLSLGRGLGNGPSDTTLHPGESRLPPGSEARDAPSWPGAFFAFCPSWAPAAGAG